MLQSNQPYQRVDDGVGAGLIGGAVVGAAGYGATAYGLPKMKQTSPSLRMNNAGGSVNIDPNVLKGLSNDQRKKMGVNSEFKKSSKPSRASQVNKTLFGSGKRKAITAGASIIGSSIIGASIDGANN
jgi:hypothetical protein